MFSKEQFEKVVTFFNEENLWAAALGDGDVFEEDGSGNRVRVTDETGFKVAKGKTPHKYLSVSYPQPSEMPSYMQNVALLIDGEEFTAAEVKINPYAWKITGGPAGAPQLSKNGAKDLASVQTYLTNKANATPEERAAAVILERLLSTAS